MPTIGQLSAHLEQVFGDPVALTRAEHVSLPVYLARTYELWRGELVGHPVLFALARRSRAARTPKRIEAEARALQNAAKGEFVVLVFSRMETHVRRRLIRSRTAFLVPGRQLFLPTVGVDLSERGLGPQRPGLSPLDWPGQVTVLRHLLWRDVEDRSLRSIAGSIGYAAMTLSRAQHQLADTSIAEVHRRGRAHVLRFIGRPEEVWEAALPHLRSPIRRTTAIRMTAPLDGALAAGLSALTQRTQIADASIPTVAMDRRRAASARRDELYEACPDADEADAQLELWNYDPLVLSRGERVDALSLFLSIRDNPDARVEQAAEQLLEQVRW